MLFEGDFHAFQNGGSKRILGINDPDLLVAERLPEPVHLLARLVEIGRPHVHNPVAQRHIKCLRAGEQANERNLGAIGHGDILHGSRCPDKEAERENLFAHQMVKARLRLCGIVAVVCGDELELPPIHATFVVDQAEISLRASDGFHAEEMRWPFQSGAGSDYDFALRYTGRALAISWRRRASDKNGDQAEAQDRLQSCDSHFALRTEGSYAPVGMPSGLVSRLMMSTKQ